MSVFLLTQSITKTAQRTPEKEAIRCGKESLSYEALERRSNSLARTLIEQGVGRGDRVGIYMNKGLESAVSLYGIMKAGAAYVPLDPFAPTSRLGFVIRNCGIRCLVTRRDKQEGAAEMATADNGLTTLIGVTETAAPVTSMGWDEVNERPSETPPDLSLTEQDLAYILYTSGSTGDPKGIMHTHRSGLSFAEWAAETYGLRAEDRLSNHAPLHFDLSTFDFFAGARVGATTVIIPDALKMFPANLSRLIQTEKLTVWYSVPFALIQLMLRGKMEAYDFSSLRWVLFAGEPFPTKHLRELVKRLPTAQFSNLYGPTETNVCTYYNVLPIADDDDEPIPIGIPCANVESLIVDADDEPVAAGEVGELLIRGPLVMRGYWARPDLTDRVFFRRPAFEQFEDIFYRTGDLVQQQADGNLKYLGRKDRQIKTRGYRVELDEIEVAMLAHEGVQETAVYPIPDSEGSNLIEAAVIPRENVSLNETELINHLSGRLPSYAVPVKITIMTDFPRTSTGKINRRELRDQAIAAG
jgi:amino acid adenylation domain-containing protein